MEGNQLKREGRAFEKHECFYMIPLSLMIWLRRRCDGAILYILQSRRLI
jgi:hypothetical protein